MRQSWQDVTFLHWPFEPAVVRPLVPAALELDLYDGAAWVGLVPFKIRDLTLPHAPAVPHLSHFPETNVRTYARDRAGAQGVWFFSLDAARLLAVIGARAGYALPYFWSKMSVTRTQQTVQYRSRRIYPPRIATSANITIGTPILQPTDFDLFLTMRLRLYAKRFGTIWKADVSHAPWPLHHANLITLDDGLVTAAGLPKPQTAPLLHYAPRVDVMVGPPIPI